MFTVWIALASGNEYEVYTDSPESIVLGPGARIVRIAKHVPHGWD